MNNRLYRDQFLLRLPDGLRELVKASAIKNGRTMNAEVIYHLLRAYSAEKEKADATAS